MKEILAEKKDNLAFGRRNLPEADSINLGSSSRNRNQISCLNIRVFSQYFSMSVENKSRRDIKDLKVLIVWYKRNQKIHYSAYYFQDLIPSNLAKTVEKIDGELISVKFDSYEIRVIDYKILPSSGMLEFK